MKKIVIVGATSSIAEHCARAWVMQSPVELVLLGRDRVKTEKVAKDLNVRSPQSAISVETANFLDAHSIDSWVKTVFAKGTPDIVLIAHGTLPDQQVCQADLSIAAEAMMVNAVSPVLFAEAFAGAMQEFDHGTLAIIGSVAGDRGRKSNYVYGAAKGLVSRYAQGLQHRMATTNVRIVLVKPGPTETPMTAHLTECGKKLANVDTVAATIVAGISTGKAVIYAPKKWSLIMSAIIHMPNLIFKKLDI